MSKRKNDDDDKETSASKSVKTDEITLKDLRLDLHNWSCLVKITRKGTITHYAGGKGGFFLRFSVIDSQQTEVNCLAFGQDAYFFDEQLSCDKCYYITNAKVVSDKFDSTKLDLVFSQAYTTIEKRECQDLKFDSTRLQFSFKRIEDILNDKTPGIIGNTFDSVPYCDANFVTEKEIIFS